MKEAKAKVIKIEGNKVWLDQTIFSFKSQGEPCDQGWINDQKVITVEKDNDDNIHIMEKEPSFKPDDEVEIKIDWERRYKIMKGHTSMHLISAVMDKFYQVRAVAGVVGMENCKLSFKIEIEQDILDKVMQEVNKIITQGAEIKTYFDDKRDGFRWCDIAGTPKIPCGGVHVKNVNEINSITLIENKVKGNRSTLALKIE